MIILNLSLPVSPFKWKSLSESLLRIVKMYHHDGEMWMRYRLEFPKFISYECQFLHRRQKIISFTINWWCVTELEGAWKIWFRNKKICISTISLTSISAQLILQQNLLLRFVKCNPANKQNTLEEKKTERQVWWP